MSFEKMHLLFHIIVFTCLIGYRLAFAICPGGDFVTNRTVIRSKLYQWDKVIAGITNQMELAKWNWHTNLTPENERIKSTVAIKVAEKYKHIWLEAICFDCESAGCNEMEKRMLRKLSNIGSDALPPRAFEDFTSVKSTMENIYATAKVCPPDGSACMTIDQSLANLFAYSGDYCKLQWGWESWRNETGRKMRGYYLAYVMLLNKAAEINGFASAKDMWTSPYTDDDGGTFFDQMEQAWLDVKPLYQQLHAYVRRKLRTNRYSQYASYFPKGGHIPAHLLGDISSERWTSLYPLLMPYPNAPNVDVTALLQERKVTTVGMLTAADVFFQSIGLDPMPNDFWENSIFERRNDAPMLCQASAWDLFRKTDFRIKMCSQVSREGFMTTHHEMGHIQYFMKYKNQPAVFRDGANPGFHEAIGDLIALSVMTPNHLKAVGLLPPNFVENEQSELNLLMHMALEKVAFLPFGYLVDKYRWSLFDVNMTFSQLNDEWWKLRCSLQGVSPPVARSETDFDAGHKFHVAASVPFDRYFFAFVAQFQFHRAICQRMGFKKDFHKCDIYRNQEATKSLRDAMSLGSSRPYPEVLKLLTNSSKLDASALVDYFDPLYRWLVEQNKGEKVGWDEADCSTVEVPSPCGNYNSLNFGPPQKSTEMNAAAVLETAMAWLKILGSLLPSPPPA